jgi:hypothetical protein
MRVSLRRRRVPAKGPFSADFAAKPERFGRGRVLSDERHDILCGADAKERRAMRYQTMIFPVLAISLFAVACDSGDNPPEIPRTVPPNLKSSITTIDAPAIKPREIKPTKPPIVMGSGPIYET